jgi:hypothetical protein
VAYWFSAGKTPAEKGFGCRQKADASKLCLTIFTTENGFVTSNRAKQSEKQYPRVFMDANKRILNGFKAATSSCG